MYDYETENGWQCRDCYDVDPDFNSIECSLDGKVEVVLEGKSLSDYEIYDDETGETHIDDKRLTDDIEAEW